MASRRAIIRNILENSSDDDELLFNFSLSSSDVRRIIRRLTIRYDKKVIGKIGDRNQDDFITSTDNANHPPDLTRLRWLEVKKLAPIQENEISSSCEN